MHTVIGAAAGKIGDAAAGDHSLGGRASFSRCRCPRRGVFSISAVRKPLFGERLAKGSAALAGADDDSVVMLRGRHKGRRWKR